MKKYLSILAALSLVFAPLTPAFAVSANWTGGDLVNSNWSDTDNWSATPVPGTGDNATFNAAAGAGGPVINLGGGVTVGSVIFDTAAAAAYTIGVDVLGTDTLTLNNGGGIVVNNGVVQTEIVQANVSLSPNASFTNNGANDTFLMYITGDVSGGGVAGTLTLNGSDTGSNSVLGNISDGAGALAVTKSEAGTWVLSGTNTYSGGTTVQAAGGTLFAFDDAKALGTGAVTMAGGTLVLISNTGLAFNNNVNVTGNAEIDSDTNTAVAGVTHTLGTLNIGNKTLTIGLGPTATSTQGLTFGAVTLTGNATINANEGAGGGLLTLASVTGAGQNLTIGGSADTSITGAITTTTGTLTKNGSGALILNGTNSYTGTTTINAGTLALLSGSDLIAGTLVTFTGDALLYLSDGSNIISNITNTQGAANNGNITTAGNSVITGTVGATGVGRLGSLTISGAAGTTAEITLAAYATDATIGAGTLKLDTTSNITTTTIGTGTLSLANAADLTGTTITFTGDGLITLSAGSDITADITNTQGAANNGNITTAGNSIITGLVGATGVGRLGSLTINGAAGTTAEITLATYATDATIGAGTLKLDTTSNITTTTIGAGTLSLASAADLTGTTITFTGDGLINLSAGSDITANITNTSLFTNNGNITTAGNSMITGSVGAAGAGRLGSLTIGGAAGTTAEITLATYATDATIGAGTLQLDTTSDITTTSIGAGTLTLASAADLTGNLRLTGAGTALFSDGSDLTGGITNATGANIGTLTLLGTSTVSGAIGTSNITGLSVINAGAAGKTATFSSDVYATDTKVTGTGTVAFGGNVVSNIDFDGNGTVTVAGSKNITGTVTNSTDGFGTLTFLGSSTTGGNIGVATTGDLLAVNVNAGTLTLGNNIAAITTTLNGSGNISINGNRTITGNLTHAGTSSLTLGANTLTLNGTGVYTMGAGQSLNVSITDASTFGKLLATGNAAVTGGTVNVSVGSAYIASGTTFLIIDGAAGGDVSGLTVTDNSLVLNFTGSTGLPDYTLTAVRTVSYASVSNDGNTEAVGKVLDGIAANNPTGDMVNVLTALDSMSSAQQIAGSLATMHPDVSSGAMQGTRTLNSHFLTTISNRLSFSRSQFAMTGISTGDMFQGAGFWLQGIGGHANQGERGGIEGYSANTFGTTIGFDKLFGEHIRAGLAGGYGFGAINAKTPGSPSDDINSFQTTLYGSYDSVNLCRARQKHKYSRTAVRNQEERLWYVDGMLTFSQNNYDSRRDISLGPTSRTAKADHYGQQYSTKFEAGYTFLFEKTRDLEITPFTSLGYSYLYMNKYHEHGADSLDLSVAGAGFNELQQGLGMKLAYPVTWEGKGTFVPSIKGAWLFDYLTDKFETSASFAGGGSSFNTYGVTPARNAFLLGSEIAFLNRGNMTLTGNFDLEFKDAYTGFTYYLTVRYDF